MFQFTSTYVVNSNRDSSGKNKFWVDTANGDTIFRMLHGVNIPVTYNQSPLDDEGDKYSAVVYKKEGYEGIMATATYTLPTAPAAGDGPQVYRLVLHIRLQSGNASSAFARDQVFQGKPIYIEFTVNEGDTAGDIQNSVMQAINTYNHDLYIRFEAGINGTGALVLTGVLDFEMFVDGYIEQLVYTQLAPFPNRVFSYDKVSDAVITPNRIGFGNYANLMNNYRLPTLAANRFTAVNQEELPVMGTLYTQYIIHFFARRGILGQNAVGDLVRSKTTHVFFVANGVVADFEAALTGAGATITNAPGYNPLPPVAPTAITVTANPTTYGAAGETLSFQVVDNNGNSITTGLTLTLTTNGSQDTNGDPLDITLNSANMTAIVPAGAVTGSGDLLFTVTLADPALTGTATVAFA